MKFIVEPSVFENLKDVCFAIVVATQVDNTQKKPEIADLLDKNIEDCEVYFDHKQVKHSEEIRCYREAFQKLNVNPNKYMCSIEALLTRISKKKGIPSINPLVDLGNAISLKYKVPIGAHDLNSTNEDFYLRYTQLEDTFIPFGETASEPVESEELVYATGHSVRTRRWIWRQSEQGKITSDTHSILFPIDGFNHANQSQVLAAQEELANLLNQYFQCNVQTGWIEMNNNEFTINS